MANLENIINQKTVNDAQWKEERQSERGNAIAIQDAGVEQITTDSEGYARYLEMQGDNPTYSAGNIALMMLGMDGATQFGTRDRWKQLGRTVMDTEANRGGPVTGRGYTLTDARPSPPCSTIRWFLSP